MTEEQMRDIIVALNQISWRQIAEITTEAEALIQEHIAKMRKVLEGLKHSRGMSANDAYAMAQSAGSEAAMYAKFFDLLWSGVSFKGAGTREPMILTIASSYFWESDPDLKDFENPWRPLVELYRRGYTSSFNENDEDERIDLIIGYKGAEKSFALYSPEKG